jgi:glutathione S-transferase
VREALSLLDVDVEVRPCPEGAHQHRAELRRLGGKEQIPMLYDPNTQKTLYDSNGIIDYLGERYGRGKPPKRVRPSKMNDLSSTLASLLRGGKTLKSVSAQRPTLPLELWSYEAGSECRLVREVLGRYALPYVLYNAAKNSAKRAKLRKIAGGETLPYLIDPNRGISVAGAERIAHYLHETYGVKQASERPNPLRRAAPAH